MGYPFDLPDHTLSLLRRQSFTHLPDRKPGEKPVSPLLVSVKGITLPKLIEKIIFYEDTEVQRFFLTCYRNVCKPLELAKLLKLRYEGPDSSGTRHQISYFASHKDTILPRTLNFFSDFVDSLHGPDFAGPEGDELFELINQFSQDHDCFTQDQLLRLLALQKRGQALSGPDSLPQVKPYRSNNDNVVLPQLSIDDIVHEIISQEFSLFAKIHPSELLSLAWSTKHKHTRAPTVTRLIEIFNWVTTWISTRILMGTTPEARGSLIEFFISVGMRMKQLNNLNGVMEVTSALGSTPIARLNRSWALVSKQSMDDFTHMTELMDCFQNFKAYRQYLSQIDPSAPCLPYIGLLLTDITFICEGNSAQVDQLINVTYVKMLGSALCEINRRQRRGYQLPTPASSIYMEMSYNPDDLYTLSNLREDKTPVQNKDHARRAVPSGRRTLSNTDFVPRVPHPTAEDRHILTANGKVLNYKTGDVIFLSGQRNDNLYFVSSGKVALRVVVGRLSETLLEIDKNEFFGLVSFLDGHSTWHDAVASEPCTILEIQKPLVAQLLEYDVDFASRIYKYFANIISDLLRRGQALINKWRKNNSSEDKEKEMMRDMNRLGMGADGATSNAGHLPHIHSSSGPSSPKAGRAGGPSLVPRSASRESVPMDVKSHDVKFSGSLFNISQVALKVYECKFKLFSGNLYIFPSYICFFSRVFGFAKKIVVYCTNISDILPNETSFIVSEFSQKRYKFQMASEEVQKEAAALSRTIMNKKNARIDAPVGSGFDPVPEHQSVSSVLSESEWMLLLHGAQLGTFPPGHVFIKEGSRPSGFFQIVKGVCGIQCQVDSKVVTVAKRREGDLFGEMSFLDEQAVASASVVALTEVEVYSLHESFANVLLNAHAGIAPKFYRYLALILVGRLRELISWSP